MIRPRLIRSSSAISKSNRFPVVLPLLDCNSVISKPHYLQSFSTDSPVGPFVGSDDHIVRVVNRKGNACRQARVHWLLASLVLIQMWQSSRSWGTLSGIRVKKAFFDQKKFCATDTPVISRQPILMCKLGLMPRATRPIAQVLGPRMISTKTVLIPFRVNAPDPEHRYLFM